RTVDGVAVDVDGDATPGLVVPTHELVEALVASPEAVGDRTRTCEPEDVRRVVPRRDPDRVQAVLLGVVDRRHVYDSRALAAVHPREVAALVELVGPPIREALDSRCAGGVARVRLQVVVDGREPSGRDTKRGHAVGGGVPFGDTLEECAERV